MIVLPLLAQQNPPVSVQAAYSEPDPKGIGVEKASAGAEWRDGKGSLVWYGETTAEGDLRLSIHCVGGAAGLLKMTVNGESHKGVGAGGLVGFGEFHVRPGKLRVALSTDTAPGPRVTELEWSGPVRFATSERRNAASVHLHWPTPKGEGIRWFYNEAAMLTTPVWSYTMACGFSRGYFGMQVNSPTERRVIFSVWDAGNEAVDRTKVGAENRVALVAKGEGVFADSFGNEGTGGHAHLTFPWRTGKPLRFLVGCRQEGERTLYAGYFMAPGDHAWRLVAAFRAPKDGGPLRGLYSFSENFEGSNGQLWRESAFGPAWIGKADGSWQPLTTATFTTDGHGKQNRWDYDAFVKGGRLHLRHGGFVPGKAKYGDTLTLDSIAKRPGFPLPTLPE